MGSSLKRKRKVHLSDLVEKELRGLSPIQTIMKMAENQAIRKMGLNPEEVISFGGGWCNHIEPEALRNAYQTIINDATLFHQSGRYSPIRGDSFCREQICRFENTIYGLTALEPQNILLGH